MRFKGFYQGKCLVSCHDNYTGENLNIEQMIEKLNELNTENQQLKNQE